MSGITLLLNRKNGDLWLDHDGGHFEVIWNVTGVIRKGDTSLEILRRGKTIGLVWRVDDIREEWAR